MSALAGILAATGGKYTKFPTIGAKVSGTIAAAPEVRQRTEYGSGKPLTWDDGSPQQEIVLTLTTEERDPADPNDDGARKVVIKAWGPQMRELKRALTAVKATDVEVGGQFSMEYSSDGEPSKPGFPAPKLYTMTYSAPSATAGLLADNQPQGSQAPTQQAAPSGWGVNPSQPAQQATPAGGDTGNKVRQLIAMGLDDDAISGATGLDKTVIAQLRTSVQ